MKRDMDLVRKILMKMEDDQGYEYLQETEIKTEGYPDSAVQYHLRIMIEKGLITNNLPNGEGISNINSTYIEYIPETITWEGHEFLEGIRKEETWEKIKKEAVNLSFVAIKACILSNIENLTPQG